MSSYSLTRARAIQYIGLIFVLAAFFVFGSPVQAGVRVQSSNLTLLGSIGITHNDLNCPDTPNSRGLGLTYDPTGNGGAGSFFISGRLFNHCIGEITKPAVGGTATFLQNYADPTNGTTGSIAGSGNGAYIGGHLLYNGSFYTTVFTYYDANGDQDKTIYKHNRTLNNNSGMVGPTAVGSGQQGLVNQYMDNVPSAFQSLLGGPAVIGGCCESIISRTSLGPALYAFNPENLASPIPLVGYPDGHQTLNPWGNPGSHPEANGTTKIGGVTFIEGSDTVLFVGTTGKGEQCYGTGCTDPDNPGVQGVHAYPYVHYMWAYDVDDLAEVKAGTKQMWEVFPYATWELPSLGSVASWDEWSVTGIAFDPAANRLYISKSRDDNGEAWSHMYVYSVSGLSGADTTPPAAPTGLAVE